jgi:ubiquinone/menaquinone biosynthesis C-methylase UbiE
MAAGTPRPASPRPKGHRLFAAMYDRINARAERRLVGPLRARMLSSLRGRVLEIGAGTGANFPHYPPGAEVVAVEPDPYMLRRAGERLRQLPDARIDLREGDAQALPFPDASFDHVVSTLVLCTVPDLTAALAEIRRVLKPDGRFHFLEHVRGEGLRGRAQDLVRPAWRYVAAGCIVNRRTGEAIEQAGFTIEALRAVRLQGLPFLIGVARPG